MTACDHIALLVIRVLREVLPFLPVEQLLAAAHRMGRGSSAVEELCQTMLCAALPAA